MDNWKATLLHRTNLTLGEGARWHAKWEKFLFVDIRGKLIGTFNPKDQAVEMKSLPKMPGMVAPTHGNELLLGLQGELALMDFESGHLETLIAFDEDVDNRCNDGSCDAMGRLWVGTMNVDAKLNAGNLYCYDGNLRHKLISTSVSNGLCWSADQKSFYYIDSFEYNIMVFDFDLPTGRISNGRIVVEFTDMKVCADGMCIDQDGMLWVAIWGGFSVNRYNPITGTLIGKVEIGVPNVTSCAFGGKDMKQLFITTAKADLSAEDLEKYPLSGSLFTLHTEVSGTAAYPFQHSSA